jgi:hypothetical protein
MPLEVTSPLLYESFVVGSHSVILPVFFLRRRLNQIRVL